MCPGQSKPGGKRWRPSLYYHINETGRSSTVYKNSTRTTILWPKSLTRFHNNTLYTSTIGSIDFLSHTTASFFFSFFFLTILLHDTGVIIFLTTNTVRDTFNVVYRTHVNYLNTPKQLIRRSSNSNSTDDTSFIVDKEFILKLFLLCSSAVWRTLIPYNRKQFHR